MQKLRGQDGWSVPDDIESELRMRKWKPLPTHEEYKAQVMKWAFARDYRPPRLKFKWPPEMNKKDRSEIINMTDEQFNELKNTKDFRSNPKYLTAAKYRSAASKIRVEKELRSDLRSMTAEQLEHQLEWMAKERRPVLKETDQFKIMLNRLRNTTQEGKKEPSASLTPEECIKNIVWFIHYAGKNGIRAKLIENKFYPRSGDPAKRLRSMIQSKSKLHRWLTDLVTIGYLERKEFVVPSRRNPKKKKKSVYYRTTEEVKFPPAMFKDMIEWDLSIARLEDQIAHMPDFVTDSQFVKAYGINVPELAITACRRLYIAKDLLLHKAGILDPDKAIDELYKRYYGTESPDPPGVL